MAVSISATVDAIVRLCAQLAAAISSRSRAEWLNLSGLLQNQQHKPDTLARDVAGATTIPLRRLSGHTTTCSGPHARTADSRLLDRSREEDNRQCRIEHHSTEARTPLCPMRPLRHRPPRQTARIRHLAFHRRCVGFGRKMNSNMSSILRLSKSGDWHTASLAAAEGTRTLCFAAPNTRECAAAGLLACGC